MTARLALITIALASGVPLHAQPPLQDLLARAAAYHADYTRKVSGVSLEEQTLLMDVSGGVTRGIVRISADVVLTDVSRELVALRDVYAIDTRPHARAGDPHGVPADPVHAGPAPHGHRGHAGVRTGHGDVPHPEGTDLLEHHSRG
jgi:hypothetical protein